MEKKTYQQLMAEIAELQKEADQLRSEALRRVNETMDRYGLTAEDLGLAPRRQAAKRGITKVRAKKSRRGVVRYRDEAGNTWSGFGRRPQWFLDAIEAGKPPQDLLAT